MKFVKRNMPIERKGYQYHLKIPNVPFASRINDTVFLTVATLYIFLSNLSRSACTWSMFNKSTRSFTPSQLLNSY